MAMPDPSDPAMYNNKEYELAIFILDVMIIQSSYIHDKF
jgi:hypothetical protein